MVDAVRPELAALFTDQYELTMLQSYFAEGMDGEAVFELFFRELPEVRNFAVAAGLGPVLSFLEGFQFTDPALDYIGSLDAFGDAFVDRLRELRFTGDVNAPPEGTIVLPNEPLLQVIAPLPEAQVIETMVLNRMHYATVAASKAVRSVLAADGRAVVDFAARRTPGVDGAAMLSRAACIAGFKATSNLLAGRLYDLPVTGTMAHSYIEAFGDDESAFEAFARMYPGTTLLIDTFDVMAATDLVIEMSRRLGDGFNVGAVRIDSGDLGDLAGKVRQRLDDAGLNEINIFASGGLDEYRIAEHVAHDDPIDGFGVGTKVGVSKDAPDIDCAYKLVAYRGEPKTKLSTGVPMLPGRKQVWRQSDSGVARRDVIGLHDESFDGRPLLRPVMRRGEVLDEARESVPDIADRLRGELDGMPVPLRQLDPADPPYPVELSEQLGRTQQRLQRELSP